MVAIVSNSRTQVEYEPSKNIPCGRYFHDACISDEGIFILGGRTRLKSSLEYIIC